MCSLHVPNILFHFVFSVVQDMLCYALASSGVQCCADSQTPVVGCHMVSMLSHTWGWIPGQQSSSSWAFLWCVVPAWFPGDDAHSLSCAQVAFARSYKECSNLQVQARLSPNLGLLLLFLPLLPLVVVDFNWIFLMWNAGETNWGISFLLLQISTRDWTHVIMYGLRHPYRKRKLTGPEENIFIMLFQEGRVDLIEISISLHVSLMLIDNTLVFQ